MESALDVLSRAATMVQDKTNETRLTSKELPNSSWRREKRLRTNEYHQPHHIHSARDLSSNSTPPPNAHCKHSSESSHPSSVSNNNAELNPNPHQISIMMAAAAAASIRPFCRNANRPSSPIPSQHSSLTGHIHHLGQIAHTHVLQHINTSEIDDVPLDMSVSNLKQRNSPPPPYREPLPGSNFSSSISRPSVITQAPPKRDKDATLLLNRENDNRSSESIDEHFRRSLGNDYFALFSKNSQSNQSANTPSPQPQHQQQATVRAKTPTPSAISSSSEQTDANPPPDYPSNFPPSHFQTVSQQTQQTPIIITPKANNALLTPVCIAAQNKGTKPSSLPLPLVIRSVTQPHSTTKSANSPLSSPLSSVSTKNYKLGNTIQAPAFNTSLSRPTSPSPPNYQQQQSLIQQQHHSIATTQLSIIENSPSSPSNDSPAVHVSNPPLNLPSIMRIKTEPGLHSVKSLNPTPPASPTSITNPSNSSTNYLSHTRSTPSPSSPIASSLKPSINETNTSADVVASVDDHFAKALGDTWKKLQENKDIRK